MLIGRWVINSSSKRKTSYTENHQIAPNFVKLKATTKRNVTKQKVYMSITEFKKMSVIRNITR